jgi:hypothetical protein
MINDWLKDWMICPGCTRLKISPAHWFLRSIGWCDGKGWLW